MTGRLTAYAQEQKESSIPSLDGTVDDLQPLIGAEETRS
jgi:hypothetical protein